MMIPPHLFQFFVFQHTGLAGKLWLDLAARQRNAVSAKVIEWSEVGVVLWMKWEVHAIRGQLQVVVFAKGHGWKDDGKVWLERSGHWEWDCVRNEQLRWFCEVLLFGIGAGLAVGEDWGREMTMFVERHDTEEKGSKNCWGTICW